MSDVLKGVVFDIHRFALHDGPGIRTTVFLKGCSLRCQWCHNPESISPLPQLGYFEDRCTLCGECVDICPNQVHEISEGQHLLSREKCTTCGLCVEACPNNALSVSGKEMGVDEVVDILLKDKIYFDESGGGMTLSGGEPLMQPEFTLEVLRRSKTEGIHTCIDTSGAISQNVLKKIIDYTDLFLFDYKATSESKHLELTGQSNERILANLQFLHDAGKEIILRCPMIPNVNDPEEHLYKILDLEHSLTKLKGIELMPYHATGASKYQRYGILNPLKDLMNPNPDYSDQLLKWFKKHGSDKIMIKE